MAGKVRKTNKAAKASRPPKSTKRTERIEISVNGVPVPISPELEAAVERARKGMLESLPKEMTTNQAAEFLDVSRPFVIKLVRQGELPCRMVGTHRRIPAPAVMEYREKMFQKASRAADEMSQISQRSGLYDDEKPANAD